MEQHERLKMAISYLKMEYSVKNDKEIAARMGASPATISRAQKGDRKSLTNNFLRRFNKAYESVFDIDWLMYGRGTMLNPNYEMARESPLQQKTCMETRPRLPWKAMSGGGLRAYYEGEFRSQCEERSIFELFPSYQFSVTVDTNDMSPYLNVGDLVACRQIAMDYIVWGGVYLIDTDGGAIIRRIYESDIKGKMKLVAENEKYHDITVDKKIVKEIFKIVGSVRVGI